MKLKRLKLQNFKCFQEEQTLDFERLTILTGANSSGKSSILYSILGSTQSGEFPLQFSTNGKYVNMGDFKEISHNHNKNNEIKIGFTFEKSTIQNISTTWVANKKNNLPELKELEAESDYFKILIKKNRKYTLSVEYYSEKDPFSKFSDQENLKNFFKSLTTLFEETKQKKNTSGNKTEDNIFTGLTKTDRITNIEFSDLEELKNHFKDKRNFRLQQIMDSLSKMFKDYDEKVNFISSFRLNPERTYLEKTKTELKVEKFGEGYLDQIILWETKKSEKLIELISIMKKLSLLVEIESNRLDGGRFEMLVKTKNKGVLASLSDVGFGISQFLPIIVADLQLPKDSSLFIAQPEIHLHPSVQSLYGGYLVDQIKSTKKNYTIETHSEYLINRIRLAIVKGEINESDTAIYFIENKDDDAKIHKIDFKKNGQILNAPEDFFNTYMMDVMEIALSAE